MCWWKFLRLVKLVFDEARELVTPRSFPLQSGRRQLLERNLPKLYYYICRCLVRGSTGIELICNWNIIEIACQRSCGVIPSRVCFENSSDTYAFSYRMMDSIHGVCARFMHSRWTYISPACPDSDLTICMDSCIALWNDYGRKIHFAFLMAAVEYICQNPDGSFVCF